MKIRNLINWRELSRLLAGNCESIRANKVPQKYEAQVNKTLKAITNSLKK